ncbi:MAG: UvrD-helicase domain-containing protein [Acidobacteria bacterium]|nr:UvrD-helicase domain-containing protein [Acidobacteriota bacterium]
MNNPDDLIRNEALDTTKSFIVEAPAGSGKTGLLIQRYIKLLLDPEVKDPAQVLAITFTIKATEEIRARVLDALQRAQKNTAPKNPFDALLLSLATQVLKRDKQMGWRLIEQPARMNIRTIDALASQIARTLPLLSGGLGTLQPAQSAEFLYRRAARGVLSHLGSNDAALNDALRTVLLHRDANLADVERLLSHMLAVREQWAAFVPVAEEDLTDTYLEKSVRTAMDQALEHEICMRLKRVESLIPANAKQLLTDVTAELCEEPGYKGEGNYLALHCRDLAGLPGTGCEHLPAWLAIVRLLLTEKEWRKSFAKHHIKLELPEYTQERLEHLIETLRSDALFEALNDLRSAPPYPYPADQWIVAKALFRLLRHALAELQLAFAETGFCDFTEVALAARHALAQSGGARDLAAALGTQLQHLLMDEMQDTSAAQYELLTRITEGWDGSSQTVFLVGDPKQSIYIFREARVELFLHALHTQRFGNIPLKRLALLTNFRSQGKLVDRFNELFRTVFVADKKDGIEYIDAVASAAPTEGDLTWKLARRQYLDRNAPTSASQTLTAMQQAWESGSILQAIQDARATNPKSKIAVLVRTRTHAAHIIARLHDEGITVRSVDIDALTERPEVLDLVALTRALQHLADRAAWLAVLHAPWCGLGNADLHRIAAGDDATRRHRSILTIAEDRIGLLEPAAQKRARRTLDTMKAALAQQGRLPFAQLVERTWRSLGGDAYLDATEYANCLRYFTMLQEITADGTMPSQGDLEDALGKLYAQSDAEDAVEVLTIHKAKGLEWDIVFVPALERTTRRDTSPLLNWTEITNSTGAPVGLLLAPIQSKGDDATRLNAFITALKKRRSDAEIDRLFYVAATRARHSLCLFATATELKEGDLRKVNGTLLNTAWEQISDLFNASDVTRISIDDNTTNRPAATNVFVMPVRTSAQPGIIDQLAAEGSTAHTILQRVPEDFDPLTRFTSPLSKRSDTPMRETIFERPQGSLLARALGETVHAFLEELARHTDDLTALQKSIQEWHTRMATYARARGLDQRQSRHVADETLRALRSTLASETGRWILTTHPEAESERAMIAPATENQPAFSRVDRIFLAGASSLSTGTTHRWIVDFKTAERATGIDDFLAAEKQIYAPKMLEYAKTARSSMNDARPVMLGLYYPLMDHFICWEAEL